MGRCKPLGSLNSFLSYAPHIFGANPVSYFTLRSGRWLLLAFSQICSSHRCGWQHPLDHRFGSTHSHLEARDCWYLWCFLFIGMAGNIFISKNLDAPIQTDKWRNLMSAIYNSFLLSFITPSQPPITTAWFVLLFMWKIPFEHQVCARVCSKCWWFMEWKT